MVLILGINSVHFIGKHLGRTGKVACPSFSLSLLFLPLGAALRLLRLVGAECNIHAPADFLKLGNLGAGMVTKVYAHILDEDRKVNAQKFESAFYTNPDLRSVRPPEEPKEPEPATLDLEALVEQLRKSPELANTLAALLASAPSEK